MANPRIQPEQNNAETRNTYSTMMAKCKKAIRLGYYFEAIMIDYAMIEDRLRSMIYHMGFLNSRKATKIWKKTRPALLQIVEQYKRENENTQLSVLKPDGKLKILRYVIKWAINTEEDYRDDKFLRTLKSQLEGLDLAEFLDTLDKLESWKCLRNEVVHGMLNKNLAAITEAAAPPAIEGMQLGRAVDSQERAFKRGNKVRKSVGLQNN